MPQRMQKSGGLIAEGRLQCIRANAASHAGMKTLRFRAAATLVLLTSLLGRHAAADVPPLVFPGCGATIQECIDDAPAGGVVELATDGPIDEDLRIIRGLQLVAAPGFRPVFTPFSFILATSPPTGDATLVLRGLTWEPAGAFRVIRVQHVGTGVYDVQIADNAFLGIQGSGISPLIEVGTFGATSPGPILATVRGNRFELPAAGAWPVALSFTTHTDGIAMIEENVVDSADTSTAGAVDVYHTEGDFQVWAVRNVMRIAKPEKIAINVWQHGNGGMTAPGQLAVRVLGNLLLGVDGGMRFGTSTYASLGTVDLLVAHNTIVGADFRAVQVGGNEDEAEMTGVIANNVLAHSERSDVGIHEFLDTVVETNNLLTRIDPNDSPSAPGAHSIVVDDPGFAGPGDFRLGATSHAVNSASPAWTPAELAWDLDGMPRLAGAAADLGAYELPCAPDDTAPHCAPMCSPATCHSDDPCTPTACVGQSCRVTPKTGLDAVTCACARPLPSTCGGVLVPKSIAQRAAKACVQIDRIAEATTRRQIERRVRSAQRGWNKAMRLLASPRSTLPPACEEDLAAQYTDAVARALFLILL